GNLRDAADLLTPAADQHAKFAPLYVNLANIRIRQGDFGTAFGLLDEAAQINPNQLMVAFNRGLIYSTTNQHHLAIREYLRELDVDPGSIVTQLQLGGSYETIGEHQKAIQYYRMVLATEPANMQAQSALARLQRSNTLR